MGFENFFGKKKNSNETKETIWDKIEKERNRYRENVSRLKDSVKKKGGWGKVFSDKMRQGYDFYAEKVAPYVYVSAATITLALIISGAPVMAWMPYSIINSGNYLIHSGWEKRNEESQQKAA
ncbi:MAG: hypothetical protein WCG20_00190 [bacterium]